MSCILTCCLISCSNRIQFINKNNCSLKKKNEKEKTKDKLKKKRKRVKNKLKGKRRDNKWKERRKKVPMECFVFFPFVFRSYFSFRLLSFSFLPSLYWFFSKPRSIYTFHKRHFSWSLCFIKKISYSLRSFSNINFIKLRC